MKSKSYMTEFREAVVIFCLSITVMVNWSLCFIRRFVDKCTETFVVTSVGLSNQTKDNILSRTRLEAMVRTSA